LNSLSINLPNYKLEVKQPREKTKPKPKNKKSSFGSNGNFV